MAISKSTPYVRYKKDFTSSLHLGTIHIESEYLDRTQKTTIESIHGMTWHNKVVNENKELNLLSDTQLELTDLEKQYWNTGEKCVSVDEIHTLEEVEPNEDGTYTYTVNSMEGEYIEIYDGVNNIVSTSDGLDGQFEIVYDTTEEDINGNIALDSIVPQYEITDSGVGTVTSAKSTGLTLVNHITEPSKEEVVAIEEYEGQYFTIENTVQGNIKSAILSGQTLVNLLPDSYGIGDSGNGTFFIKKKINISMIKPSTKYFIRLYNTHEKINRVYFKPCVKDTIYFDDINNKYTIHTTKSDLSGYNNAGSIHFYAESSDNLTADDVINTKIVLCEYQEGMENWDIPYFEGMQSVKMPVLTTTGKNLYPSNNSLDYNKSSKHYLLENYFESNSQYVTQATVELTTKNGKWTPVIGYEYTDGSTGEEYFELREENEVGTILSRSFISAKGKTVSKIYIRSPWGVYGVFSNIQIEKGTQATSYELYKSNILSVNEEVELRGIDEVKDELDLITGKLTQRFGEIVFDGGENWIGSTVGSSGTFMRFYTNVQDAYLNEQGSGILCDRFTSISHGNWDTAIEGIHSKQTEIHINIPTSKLESSDVSGFKKWLSSNPITVCYLLTTESVKTVDLTVQNQDGGIIPHIQTQQGITHVSTSSDGLIPVVEMSCSYDTIIKPNTTYTIKLDRPIVSDTMYLQVDLGGTMMMLDADVNAFTIKTPSTLSHSQLRLSGNCNTVKEIIVLEGNRVNDKIEYFEGMENVENPILVVSNCPYVFGKGGRK